MNTPLYLGNFIKNAMLRRKCKHPSVNWLCQMGFIPKRKYNFRFIICDMKDKVMKLYELNWFLILEFIHFPNCLFSFKFFFHFFLLSFFFARSKMHCSEAPQFCKSLYCQNFLESHYFNVSALTTTKQQQQQQQQQ